MRPMNISIAIDFIHICENRRQGGRKRETQIKDSERTELKEEEKMAFHGWNHQQWGHSKEPYTKSGLSSKKRSCCQRKKASSTSLKVLCNDDLWNGVCMHTTGDNLVEPPCVHVDAVMNGTLITHFNDNNPKKKYSRKYFPSKTQTPELVGRRNLLRQISFLFLFG